MRTLKSLTLYIWPRFLHLDKACAKSSQKEVEVVLFIRADRVKKDRYDWLTLDLLLLSYSSNSPT